MSGLSVALAKPVKRLSGNDPKPLALHIEKFGLYLSEQDAHGASLIKQISFPDPLNLSDLSRDAVRLQNEVEAMVREHSIEGRDVNVCVQLPDLILRVAQTFFMTEKELAIESQEPDFWIEHIPELADMDNPQIAFEIIHSDETDDVTDILVTVAPKDVINAITSLIADSGLNPVVIDSEPLSLISSISYRLSRSEIRTSTALVFLTPSGGRVVALSQKQVGFANFEISELDNVLLQQLESVEPSGDFWAEVGSRLAGSISQACDYLTQSERLLPFARMFVFSSYADANKTSELLSHYIQTCDVHPWPQHDANELQTDKGISLNESLSQVGFGALHRRVDADLYPSGLGDPFSKLVLSQYSETLRKNRRLRAITRAFSYATIAFFVIGFIAIASVLAPQYMTIERQASKVENFDSQLKSSTGRLQGLKQQLSKLQQDAEKIRRLSAQESEIGIINSLSYLLPQGIRLTQYQYAAGGAVELKGNALYAESLGDLLESLRQERLLTDVRSTSKSRPDGRVDFELIGKMPKQEM